MRLLAIGDVHGCLSSLDILLNLVQPTKEETLITLGDYVDRGPDSKGVLDRLIELHSKYRVISLIGNHELMMLAARNMKAAMRSWFLCGGSEALESYREPGKHVSLNDVPERHWYFLENICRPYYEFGPFFFVHANLRPDLPLDKQPDEIIYWKHLEPKWHVRHSSGKTMICGHTQQRSGVPLCIPGAICIDTWAYGDGWLTCLDVLTGQYWQANELGDTRIDKIILPE